MRRDYTGNSADLGFLCWVLLFSIVAGALVVACLAKSPSVDEYWTIAFVDPANPLPTALHAWSADSGHPVGYYALGRLLDPFLPVSIEMRRLFTNLPFATVLIVYAATRHRDTRTLALLIAAITLGQPYMIERAADYRATFPALMFLSMLAIAAVEAGERDRDSFPQAMAASAFAGLAALFDYPVALCGFASLACWIVVRTVGSGIKAAIPAAMALVFGLIIFAASIANAYRVGLMKPFYWQSTGHMLVDLAVVGATGVTGVVLPIGAAMAIRESRSLLVQTMRDRGFLLLFAALMLAAGGLIFINFFNHSMIRRQLFGILPIIAAIAGYAIWRLATARPLLLWLAGANIAAAAVAVAALVPSHVDFNRFAAAMREAQAACPSLAIYPVMPNDLENAPPLDGRFTGVAAPEPVGYDQIASKWHLRLQPVERDIRLADRQCGAMIWSENVWLDAPISPAEIAKRARVSATSEQIEHAHLLYDRQSLLLVLPPG